ncbi:MAG: DUF1538 domain-containing protein [Clostridia bacterium]|nr:DUF1538 domain-containing protein [Clostridia bacterium]
MRIWIDKLKEVTGSVLPIVLLVTVLGFTAVPMDRHQFGRFFLGAAFLTAGLTIFLIGVDQGVTPVGQRLGVAIIRPNRLWVVAVAGLFLGFLVSVAEPDLHILAQQISLVTAGLIGKWHVVLSVSVGIAVLLAAGLVRILFNVSLRWVLTGLYGLILVLCLAASPEYLAISFDASGATTGAMTVPFILALALGVALRNKDGATSEQDSFGLVAIASAGAILATLVLGYVQPVEKLSGTIEFPAPASSVLPGFVTEILHQLGESALAITPIFLVFLVCQPFVLRMRRRPFLRTARGFVFAWIGLVLLFTGVNAGFMEIGRDLGSRLAARDGKALLLLTGFALGLLTILAEPAVHVLTRQIEEVTGGSVRGRAVYAALSIGVGVSVVLSMLRILIPRLQLWHILLPGYAAALLLAHIGPRLFVGMAFDAGGVASGPMTATFVLAFAQGAANQVHTADILVDGFGVIALVALTPIITLQVLGLLYQRKIRKTKGGAGHAVRRGA